MNRGTVQDWMDDDNLLPGGLLCVMHTVASALAHMHKSGVTHNDIKPENVMLHQEDIESARSAVTVKLGDLGCCTSAKTPDTTNDYWQWGMTTFCMVTGEKFGARKHRKEAEAGFCDECMAVLAPESVGEGSLGLALIKVPEVLRKVFSQELAFKDVLEESIFSNEAG